MRNSIAPKMKSATTSKAAANFETMGASLIDQDNEEQPIEHSSNTNTNLVSLKEQKKKREKEEQGKRKNKTLPDPQQTSSEKSYFKFADKIISDDETYEAEEAKYLNGEPDIVEGLISVFDYKICIYGKSNVGKSFFALDLACSLADGDNFQNLTITKEHKVLWVAAEGIRGTFKRLRARQLAKQLAKPRPDNLSLLGQAIHLDVDAEVQELIQWARQEKPDFLFIDTLAESMIGNENETRDMSKVSQNLNLIRDCLENKAIRIVLIHHTGKHTSDTPRGAYSFLASLDNSIKLEEAEVKAVQNIKKLGYETQIIVSQDKARESSKDSKKVFCLKQQTFEKEGREYTSLYLTLSPQTKYISNKDEIVLKLFKELSPNGESAALADVVTLAMEKNLCQNFGIINERKAYNNFIGKRVNNTLLVIDLLRKDESNSKLGSKVYYFVNPVEYSVID